jgi:hypothetical protein
MRAYHHDDVRGTIELGPASLDRLDEWLAADEAAMSTHDYSYIGLYRSEADFIELSPVHVSAAGATYLLHSDRIVSTGWWRDLFRRHIECTLPSRSAAIACARDYMTLSREGFERKYG